jgi:hypothetical protein
LTAAAAGPPPSQPERRCASVGYSTVITAGDAAKMKFDDSGISVNLNQSQKEDSVSEDHTQLTDKLAAALLDEPMM